MWQLKVVISEGIHSFALPCWFKKISTKWELQIKFYLGKDEDCSQETAFPIALKNCSKDLMGVSGYIGDFQQRAGSWNIKKLLLIKESQISQVKEFIAFLYMGICKTVSSLKPFLWYGPQLSEVSILCFHILFPQGSPWGVSAVWWLLDGFSFLSFLRVHWLMWRAVIADNCDILIYLYGMR